MLTVVTIPYSPDCSLLYDPCACVVSGVVRVPCHNTVVGSHASYNIQMAVPCPSLKELLLTATVCPLRIAWMTGWPLS